MNKVNNIKNNFKSSPQTNPIRRGLRRSKRTVNFSTKVTPDFDNIIREQAQKEDCLITEMLEKYQATYLEKINGDEK